VVDRSLAKRHALADFFFSLPPLNPPGRLDRIFGLASKFIVEVETHPVNGDEYRFLTGGGMARQIGNLQVAGSFALPVTHEHKLN
jgi:hypothetical protein